MKYATIDFVNFKTKPTRKQLALSIIDGAITTLIFMSMLVMGCAILYMLG